MQLLHSSSVHFRYVANPRALYTTTSRIMAFVGGAGNDYEVARRHRDALQTFNQLSCCRDPKYDDFAPVIREQFARFKVWAENVGAHRTGRVSLDHRLRDALEVKDMVIELLRDLHEALNDGITVVPLPASHEAKTTRCSPRIRFD
jgi:hypothetical protein